MIFFQTLIKSSDRNNFLIFGIFILDSTKHNINDCVFGSHSESKKNAKGNNLLHFWSGTQHLILNDVL